MFVAQSARNGRSLARLLLPLWISLLLLGVALPLRAAVNLEYFNAVSSSSAVLLEWSTANEYNVAGFEILKKRAGEPASAYHRIGFFNAKGGPDQGAQYDMLLTQIKRDVAYCFRLREITTDEEPGETRELCGFGIGVKPTEVPPTVAATLTTTVVLFPTPTIDPFAPVATPDPFAPTPTIDPFAPTPTWTPTIDPFAPPTPTTDPFAAQFPTPDPFQPQSPIEQPTLDPFAPVPTWTPTVDPFAPQGSQPIDPAAIAQTDPFATVDPFAPTPTVDPFAPTATPDPFAQPATDPFAQPVTDPFAQPTPDPFAQPTTDPFAPQPESPLTEPVAEATPDPALIAQVPGAGDGGEPPTPTAIYIVVTAEPTTAGEGIALVVTPWPTLAPTPVAALGNLLVPSAQNLMVLMLCFIFLAATALGGMGLLVSVFYMRSRSQREADRLRLRERI